MNAEIAETAENALGLRLRALRALRSTVAVVDLAHLPPNDPVVYKMLCEADTIGVFQVESRAQMATLPRLKPKEFYDLVVQVAIIRPGPIVGQMVHPYLNRRAGREPVRYRASLARADPRANARRAAVPGAAAADRDGRGRLHRRPGRGAAARDGLQAIRAADEADRSAAARRHGAQGDYRATPRSRSSRSITSFALYGFPESHAASFALLAYASAYLKAHYPGGVLHGAAQQPADGVLSPVDARQGRAAPRRPLSSDRRADLGLGLHGRSRRRDPPRAAVRERLARTGGASDM